MRTNDIQKAIEDLQALKENLRLFPQKLDCLNTAIEALQEKQNNDKLAREGRLLILPCKEGDIVYKICKGCAAIVHKIEFEGHIYTREEHHLYAEPIPFTLDMRHEINKTIFLTLKDADKEINKRQESNL